MKSACVNTQLAVNVDWSAVDAAAEQNADTIKKKDMRLDWVYMALNVENGWYMTRNASDFRARLINLF